MPLPAWAAGLTISTTALTQQEKHAIREDVEAAGGRYSPNLSKRTTHLVTPQVVTAVSDKLAAAISGNRFSGLHVVSCSWVAASTTSKTRADEAKYAPLLPNAKAQPSADSSKTPANAMRSSKRSTSAPTTAAATPNAAQQTPWVVHFSQMVDDSIYGMPEQPSPTAHQQLAQQLQEQQLQPITEERAPSVSPEPLGRPDNSPEPSLTPGPKLAPSWQHSQSQEQLMLGLHLAAALPAAAAAAAAGLRRQAGDGAITAAGASPISSNHTGHTTSHISARRPQPLLLPVQSSTAAATAGSTVSTAQASTKPLAAQRAVMVSCAPSAQAPGCVSVAATPEISPSHQHGLKQALTNSWALGSNSCPGSVLCSPAVRGSGSSSSRRVTNPRESATADQQHDSLLLQQLMGQGSRALKRLSTQGYTSAAMTDAQTEQQQQQRQMKQQQWHQASGQASHEDSQASSSKGSSRSSVEDLVLALRRVTGDSRRGTKDRPQSPAADTAAAAAASATPANCKQYSDACSVQQPSVDVAGEAVAYMPGAAAHHEQSSTSSSMEELLNALRRATDSRRGTAELAADVATAVCPAALPLGVAAAEGEPTVGQCSHSTETGSSVDELIQAVRRATDSSRSTAEAHNDVPADVATAETLSPAAASPAAASPPAAGASTSGQSSHSTEVGSSVDQLIQALRRATDSRRNTAEAAPSHFLSNPTLQQMQQGLQQHAGHASLAYVQLTAGSRAATSNSQPGTATRKTTSIAGQSQQKQQQQDLPNQMDVQARGLQCASMFGRVKSVDHLIGALHKAPSASSHRHAHSMPAASDKAAAPAGTMVQQGAQQDGTESATVLGSGSGVNALIGALHKSTSRRSTENCLLTSPGGRLMQQDSNESASLFGNSRSAALVGAMTSRRGTEEISYVKSIAAGEQQQEQQQEDAAGSDNLFSSLKNVDELICALRRYTSENTRDAAGLGTAAADGDNEVGTNSAAADLDMQNWQAGHPCAAAAAAGARPATAAAAASEGRVYSSFDSVDDLIQPFTRVASQNNHIAKPPAAPSAKAVAYANGKPALAAATVGQLQQQGDVTGDLPGSFSSVNDLIAALKRVTGDSRRNTAEAVAPAADELVPATAICDQQQQGDVRTDLSGNFGSVDDLIVALKRVAGDSRRSTAEAVAPAAEEPAPATATSCQLQQQCDVRNDLPGSCSSVGDLIAALKRVTSDSRRCTAESVAPAVDQSVPANSAGDQQQQQQQDDVASDWSGSFNSVDDLIAALKRVTGDSRRNTAEAVAEAAAIPLPRSQQSQQPELQQVASKWPGTVDTQLQLRQQQQLGVQQFPTGPASGSIELGLALNAESPQQQQQQQKSQCLVTPNLLDAAAGDTRAAAEPASVARSNATPVAEFASDMSFEQLTQQHFQQQQQQQQELDAQQSGHSNDIRSCSSSNDADSTGNGAAGTTCNVSDSSNSSKSVDQLVAALRSVAGDSRRRPVATAPVDHATRQEIMQALQQQQQVDAEAATLLPDMHYASADPGTTSTVEALLHALKSTAATALQVGGGSAADADLATTSPPDSAVAAPSELPGETEAAEPASIIAAAAAQDAFINAYRVPTSTTPEESAGSIPGAKAAIEKMKPKLSAWSAASSSELGEAHNASTMQPADQAASSEAAATAAALAVDTHASPSSNVRQPAPANQHAAQCPPANQQQQQQLATTKVVFDPCLPADLREQLAAKVTSAGGAVVSGAPHLGCGANTVVAEPERAAQWLPLLMHVLSPAWLLKACRQQDEQQQQAAQAQRVQQLLHISPDVARSLAQQVVRTLPSTNNSTHDGSREPLVCDSGWFSESSGMGGDLSTKCSSTSAPCYSSSTYGLPVLVLPPGDSAASNGWLTATADGSAVQQHRDLMPPGLLAGVIWSIDQDPRAVGDEEAESVIFQGWVPSITLLLPQDSSGVLGHAAVTATATQPDKGLTCGDVLAAVHNFYKQQVLLQPALRGAAGSSSPGSVNTTERNVLAGIRVQEIGQQHIACPTHGSKGPGVVMQRVQLLGARLQLDGLVRATTDPHSNVYELCLSG